MGKQPPKLIIYNGRKYGKHPEQPYYYNSNSKPYRSLHRQMWFDAHGEIPEGYHVHHKNGNAFDNRLENFELREGIEHVREHSKKLDPEFLQKLAATGREHAKAWHKSEEGRKWHRKNAKKMGFGQLRYGNKNCEECGVEFELKAKHARFCSNTCKSNWRRKNNPDMITKVCPVCGVDFQTRKYLPKQFCSIKCRPAPNPNGRGKK